MLVSMLGLWRLFGQTFWVYFCDGCESGDEGGGRDGCGEGCKNGLKWLHSVMVASGVGMRVGGGSVGGMRSTVRSGAGACGCGGWAELATEIVASSLGALGRPPTQYPNPDQYSHRQWDCLFGWPGKMNVVEVVQVLVDQRVGRGVEELKAWLVCSSGPQWVYYLVLMWPVGRKGVF